MKKVKNMKDLKKISVMFPNDMEFGNNVRSIKGNSEEFVEFLKKYPNDIDLGRELRKFLNN